MLIKVLLVTFLLVVSATMPAFAISADLAKRCREMTIKAHPPAVAGSQKGSAQVERDYFKTCIAKNGKMDDEPQPTQTPAKN